MDIRFALRTLWRNKTFAAIAILTLALGIGANTAIFSVVNGVLLRPLPYKDPDRLFVLQMNLPSLSRVAPVLPVSSNHFTEWRRQCTACEGLSALTATTFNLTGDGPPERVSGARVSSNLFVLLGIRPQLGRTFNEEEEHPGSDQVVMMSDAFWKSRFLGDPAIVGKTIRLDGTLYTVVGVLPPGFVPPKGHELSPIIGFGQRTDLWKPLAFSPEELQTRLGNFNYAALLRLKPGISIQQSREELEAITSRIVNSIPLEKDRAEVRVIMTPLQSEIVGNARQSLLLLMAAVGSVLLIVCVNLANLLLARGSGRRRELAVRMALGASASRVLRQLLVENIIIASAGGLLGIVLATVLVRMLIAAGPSDLPRIESIRMDGSVLLFSILLSASASIVFGLLPAWRAARSDPQNGLRGGRGLSEGRASGRLRSILVSAEVALSVMLLIAAGLLLESFTRTMRVDRGFSESGVLAVDLYLPLAKYQQATARTAFFDAILDRLRALPGVDKVGLTNLLPLSGHAEVNPIIPDGSDPSIKDFAVTDARYVNGEYFQAMGIPFYQGEVFRDSDRERKVAIVSARTAARVWPGENAIGKRFRYASRTGPVSEVVGIVGDVQVTSLQESAANQTLMVYIPYWDRVSRTQSVILKGSVPLEELAPMVRSSIWQVDPDLPVPEFRAMAQVVAGTVESQRFRLILVLAFATSAMVLAALGIYGVVSYSVSQRHNEIGIRVALGAGRSQVRRMILRDGLTPVLIGLALGIAGALAAGRLLSGLLFGVTPSDPLTYSIVSSLVILSASAACYVPARAATRVDPAGMLRE